MNHILLPIGNSLDTSNVHEPYLHKTMAETSSLSAAVLSIPCLECYEKVHCSQTKNRRLSLSLTLFCNLMALKSPLFIVLLSSIPNSYPWVIPYA